MKYLACLFALVPMQLQALSCARYGITDAYLEAAAAAEYYVVVKGDLSFDPSAAPQSHQPDTPRFSALPARVDGTHIGADGQKKAFAEDVTLEINCSGPWCPGPTQGEALMFLRKSNDGYVLTMSACKGFVFAQPLPEQERALRQCLNGGACAPSDSY